MDDDRELKFLRNLLLGAFIAGSMAIGMIVWMVNL